MDRSRLRTAIAWLVTLSLLAQGALASGGVLHCTTPDGQTIVEIGCDHGHCEDDGPSDAAQRDGLCVADDPGCTDNAISILTATTNSRSAVNMEQDDQQDLPNAGTALVSPSLRATPHSGADARREPPGLRAQLLRPLRSIILLI